MLDYDLLDEFSSDVFHEFADVSGVLEDELVAFLSGLSAEERRRLASSLSDLSNMTRVERSAVLERIQFAWEVDDEAGFFASLSEVAQGIVD